MISIFDPIFAAQEYIASGEYGQRGERVRKEVGGKQSAPNLRQAAFDSGERLLPGARFPEYPKGFGEEPYIP
jgi:hypothetical protein